MKAYMSCRDLGWAELGQETDAGLGQKKDARLDRGQMLGWAEARCWAGRRPEVGLDGGQRLGWTETRGWAGRRPEVGLDRGSSIIRDLRHHSSALSGQGGQDRIGSVRACKSTEKEGNGTESLGRAGQTEVTEQKSRKQKVRGTENHGKGGHGRAQEGNEWQGTKVSSHGIFLGRDWTANITSL
jgi:hypothetical protein